MLANYNEDGSGVADTANDKLYGSIYNGARFHPLFHMTGDSSATWTYTQEYRETLSSGLLTTYTDIDLTSTDFNARAQ